MKQKCVYILKARLYINESENYVHEFNILSENYIQARDDLKVYLENNKEDTLLKYDRVSDIWNVGSEYVIM